MPEVTNAGLVLLLVLLLFLTAYPMAMLVYDSLHTTPPGEAGAFNLDGYRAMLSRANGVVRSGEKITVIVRPEVIQRGASIQRGRAARSALRPRHGGRPDRRRHADVGGAAMINWPHLEA